MLLLIKLNEIPLLSPATKERSDIVFRRVVAMYICLFVCGFVCLFVCGYVCLSGAFDHEGVELGSQFLVGKLMGTSEGAK